MHIYRKFTPVYTQTECGNQTATLDQFNLGADSIGIGLEIEVTCKNPNPYAIKIIASTPGDTFVRFKEEEQTVQLGKLRVMPGSHLPEFGHGDIRVRMDTIVRGAQADTLLPHLLSDRAIPIYIQLQFDVEVQISFGLVSWGVSAPFKKQCGLNMAGVLVNQFLPNDDSQRSNRLGPLVCRNHLGGVQLPPVGEKEETPENGNMGFSAAQVAPQEVAAGELMKTASLGVSITLTLFFGVLCVLFSLATFAHPAGSSGLIADIRDCGGCGVDLRLLSLWAWNGAIDVLVAVFKTSAENKFAGLRVPSERLIVEKQVPKEPSERIRCPCPVWIFKRRVLTEELPYVEAPAGSGWISRLMFLCSRQSTVVASGPSNAPVRKPGYHRLATVAVDSNSSPVPTPAENMDTAVPPKVRGHSTPLLAVPTRRSVDVLEADPWEDGKPQVSSRPPSPPPPSRKLSKGSSSELHHRNRVSSAAYCPDSDQVGGASPAG